MPLRSIRRKYRKVGILDEEKTFKTNLDFFIDLTLELEDIIHVKCADCGKYLKGNVKLQ